MNDYRLQSIYYGKLCLPYVLVGLRNVKDSYTRIERRSDLINGFLLGLLCNTYFSMVILKFYISGM